MIEIRLTTTEELQKGYHNTPNAIQLGEKTHYLSDKAILELQAKLNTFAIHIVSNSACKNCGKPKQQHSDASGMCFNNGFTFFEADC